MSDLYGFAQPVSISQFRDVTSRQAQMAGMTLPTFMCRCCSQPKPITGSKFVTPKHPKDGRVCADCAPPEEPKPKRQAKPKPAPAPKVEKPAKKSNTLLTDEQVLECRAAYEFEGVKPAALVRKYGTTPAYMRNLLEYAVRSKLIPQQHRK